MLSDFPSHLLNTQPLGTGFLKKDSSPCIPMTIGECTKGDIQNLSIARTQKFCLYTIIVKQL